MTAPSRVLVVDDDPRVLDLFRGLLGSRGSDVLTAASAEEALAHLAPPWPQAALVDLVLPGRDGAWLCEHLAPMVPASAVLLMSGYLNHPALETARRAGVRAVLHKPIDLDEILRQLEQGRAGIDAVLKAQFEREGYDTPVRVLWDRRQGDRRTQACPAPDERRRTERRRPSPVTWRALGFLLVAEGP